MEYAVLASAYEKIEATRKRLEIIDLLAEMLAATPSELIGTVTFMLQGKIAPDYEGIELGVAEKLALRALGEASGITKNEIAADFRETGDVGETAFRIMPRKKQMSLFAPQSLTVTEIFGKYRAIADATGSGSQDHKMKLIANLLHAATPLEARYIMRTVVGKLRLGVADMTVIDALATAFVTREEKRVVEAAYNRCSNLRLVAETLVRDGLEGLDGIHVTPGVPLRAMLAERSGSVEELLEKMDGQAAFEYKYDGLRIQAHIRNERAITVDGSFHSDHPPEVTLFSRQLENITDQFPDVAQALAKSVHGNAIVEGECVPIDSETGSFRPFQDISRRRGRKHDLDTAIKDVPVALILFDCLYAEPYAIGDGTFVDCGQDTGPEIGVCAIDQSFRVRRDMLESIVTANEQIRVSDLKIMDTAEEIEEYFTAALDSGCEGLMAKSIADDSPYKAGARGWQWVKYKAEYRSELVDTLDLAVVGAFAGRGRRSGMYGAFLMAARNPDEDRFETVCKLGTGFDDAMLATLPGLLEPYLRSGATADSPDPSVYTKMKPDFHFAPGLVLEIFGAEFTYSPIHTCAEHVLQKDTGIALRFPRFTGRIRDDKGPADVTTTQEILGFYESQGKKKKN